MNILPKKRWHVRTKENVARVRRDEAKAAEEEKARLERVALADHEDRIRRLKMRVSDATVDSFSASVAASTSTSVSVADSVSGHVNLFSEIEMQERKNLASGNKEYQAEKKKEKDDWESKMGIMKRFAEDTKEYAKQRYWWEDIPINREEDTKKGLANCAADKVPAPESKTNTFVQSKSGLLKLVSKATSEGQHAEVTSHKKMEKHRNKRKRKHKSPSSGSSESPSISPLKSEYKIAALRAERLERERRESLRAQKLLAPKREEKPKAGTAHLDIDRTRKYNSQFNPEFAKKCKKIWK